MSKSKLATLKIHSPNHSGKRLKAIDTITPHCVVGQLSARSIAACFPKGRNASCNYGIGTDGEVVEIVPEEYRSWCSSSSANDQRAITIECASDSTSPYAFNRKVYDKLIDLCVDIVIRYGKKKVVWKGYKGYEPASDEMVFTVHRWFSNKSCPGDWLYNKMGDLVNEINSILHDIDKPNRVYGWFRVRKSWDDAKSQIGAYRNLYNAQSTVLSNPGYHVYDTDGQEVGKVLEEIRENVNIDDLARRVIRGELGNGQERREKLGSNYDEVQKRVNKMLS